MLRQAKMESTFVPKTDHSMKLWLKQRQELLVIYSQLCGIEQPSESFEKLQVFCQSLMDYLSIGHFKMFEKLAEAHYHLSPHTKGLDGSILQKISDTTDIALDFNDKYTDSESLEDLSEDLSVLGENLAHRMDWEDKLINTYLKLSSNLH